MLRQLSLSILLSLNCKASSLDSSSTSCESVDLRQSKCLTPNKNQSDTNFCFAFAAAEAVGFRLCEEISPAALGIMSPPPKDAIITPNQLWSGYGHIEEAISIGNSKGFCLEAEVPSQLILNDKTYALQREYKILKDKIAQLDHKDCKDAVNQIHLFLPAIQISEIAKYIASNQTNTDFMQLVLSNCKTRITEKVAVKSCKGPAKEKLKFIDENLRSGPIPLEVIGNSDSGGVIKVNNFSLGHAVTIIGRELQNGVCKYLIRDSAAKPYHVGGFVLNNDKDSEQWLPREDLLGILQLEKSACISVN